MLFIALFVNEYHALAYPWQSRQQEDGLVLRSSDITTIFSIATKVLEYLRLSWAGMIAWRLAFILMEHQGLEIKHLSRYLKGLPPLKRPRGKEGLTMLLLLILLPQSFIEPLIMGSLDWSFATTGSKPTTVASAEPTAGARAWYWYLDNIPNRQIAIRTAGGMVSRAWGAEDLRRPASCRHVMPITSPVNSTLLNAVLPSIQIHNITWEMGAIPGDIARYARENASALSVVNESPFEYTRTGVGALFNPGEAWNTREAVKMDHGLLRAFPGNNNEVNETCIARGTIYFTAVTVKAHGSKFVTPQVVEYNCSNDFTNLEEEIEPSIWTREALWLLPDTMTQIAIMNTSQLPTWENLDNYTETLIRISYLANWDTLHALYDDKDNGKMTLLPAQPRLRASVGFIRLYTWYGVTLLLPVTGILLKYLHRSCKRGMIADEVALLFSDTSEITKRHHDLTALTTLSKSDEELRPMLIRQSRTKEGVFKIGFVHGERQSLEQTSALL
ncbi:hypothetical protein F53441_10283 [Fusarium austroafricanum]|uniref:Uncharacterized protein n=1 Tax=Fusarium austroafricanum TaxID=2364996 RepID=A0A8H4NSF2_9HYPO|nr:hypothetical protein F53441_10283 [Fusarium austroafricanum]